MKDNKSEPKTRRLDGATKEAQRQWLMEQIPVTGETETVILPKQFYKKLTDEQFEILVTKIELDFIVGPKTAKYIRGRMRRQGIRPQDYMQKAEKQTEQ